MSDFSNALLAWHQHSGRHTLPWQIPGNPYFVWISEIMLQQTQVDTVIPYFERFINKFPNLASLAFAEEEAVLSAWSGLGYYSRARNLHRAAQIILTTHEGQFPQTAEILESLPGIGKSTAAAIASICFKERSAIMDGNVRRVLSRWACIDGLPTQQSTLKQLWTLAQALLPDNPEDMPRYTQAIMDLGATLCKRSQPLCKQCPVSSSCLALKNNCVADLPRSKPRKTNPIYEKWMLFIVNNKTQDVELDYADERLGVWQRLLAPYIFDTEESALHFLSSRGIFSPPTLSAEKSLVFSHMTWKTHMQWITVPLSAHSDLRTTSVNKHYPLNQTENLPLPAPIKKALLAFSKAKTQSLQLF